MIRWLSGTVAMIHRELRSLLVTPLAYIVGTLFLLNQGWNFALLLRVLNDPLAAPGPVMQFYFGGSFFIFWLPVIFICSALSMRLIAEERKQGTFEALLTAPLLPSQIVLGKFFGAYLFYLLLWVPTGIFYILLRGAAISPELGPILSGYLGVALVGASFLAIGLVASALATSQLASALATFVVCTLVLMSGLLVGQINSLWISSVLEQTSLLVMMQELAQGIVDTRWPFFHLAAISIVLVFASVVINPRAKLNQWLKASLFAIMMLHLSIFVGRHNHRGDWTSGQVYTLSERAREIIASLAIPVDVTVMIPTTLGEGRPNPVLAELREVLFRMAEVSPLLRIRFLDPDQDRQRAETLLTDYRLGGRELADGVLLIRAGHGAQLRRSHVVPRDLVVYATGADVQASGPRVKEFRGEEILLTHFLRVADPQITTVCFTQGHGEPAFDSLEPYQGYAHLHDLLVEANLEVKPAELNTETGLAGCDIVLIAGPTGRFPAKHIEVIDAFTRQGGDLLLLTGAVLLREQNDLASHGLEPLLAKAGIRLGERVVLDPHAMPGGTPLLAFTLVDGWGDHPATQSLVREPISMLEVRELTISRPAEVLLQSSEQSWGEANIHDLLQGRIPEFDGSVDRQGPIPIAAASEQGGSRFVVIASQDFALNALLREDVVYDHGRDLILNAIGWLSQRSSLLGIRARQREHVKLVLLPEQLVRMSLVCMIGLPGFAALFGFLVLWRRRR